MQTELATKTSQLGGEYEQKLQAIPTIIIDCEEYKVQGADLALPRCSCLKSAYSNYYQKGIVIEDQYLQKQNELLRKYLPRFKEQIAIIDKVENDLKYGDAVSVPAVKNRLTGVQQQAISSLTTILGAVSNAIEDSGIEYARLVNIKNGHLPEPCQ